MSNNRPHLYLVKVGGKIVEDPAALKLLLTAFSALPAALTMNLLSSLKTLSQF